MDRLRSGRPLEWQFARQGNTRSSFQKVFIPISYRYYETTLSQLGLKSKPSSTTKRQEAQTSRISSQNSIMRPPQSIVKYLIFWNVGRRCCENSFAMP